MQVLIIDLDGDAVLTSSFSLFLGFSFGVRPAEYHVRINGVGPHELEAGFFFEEDEAKAARDALVKHLEREISTGARCPKIDIAAVYGRARGVDLAALKLRLEAQGE